jgi:hypothetical protein
MHQGYVTIPPTKVFQDNQSVLALIENGRSTSKRTRHIDIRYFWAKEQVEVEEIILQYLPTDRMVADILTKPKQGDSFRKLKRILKNWVQSPSRNHPRQLS